MSFSSIVQKKCKCGCNRWPTLGYQGYNEQCRPDLKKEKIKSHKQKQALAGDLSKIRKLAPISAEEKVEDAMMQLFWITAEKEIEKDPHCMNCGAHLPKYFYKMIGDGQKKISINNYRASTAHVLPKRKEYGFPSVASNQINRLFLGAGCGCHNLYDRSWEDAAKMKVWPLAVEIFIKLYPKIAKEERKNIPEVLLQELPPNIINY